MKKQISEEQYDELQFTLHGKPFTNFNDLPDCHCGELKKENEQYDEMWRTAKEDWAKEFNKNAKLLKVLEEIVQLEKGRHLTDYSKYRSMVRIAKATLKEN